MGQPISVNPVFGSDYLFYGRARGDLVHNMEQSVKMSVLEKAGVENPYLGQRCWRKPDGCVLCNFTVHHEKRRYPRKKGGYIRIQNGKCTCNENKEPASGINVTGSSI